jgi:hypothetical protein
MCQVPPNATPGEAIAIWTTAHDINVTNNTFPTRFVKIKMLGDANDDGRVNILDIVFIYQATPADSRWNPDGDVNFDGVINILDLSIIARIWWNSQLNAFNPV